MRIKIKFKGTNKNVPFSTQANVNSYIHDCLGRDNPYHNAKSDYNISSLMGGRMNDDGTGLHFEDDAFIVVSSQDMTFMNKLLMGVISHQEFSYGMKLSDVEHVHEELFDGWNHFSLITPFMIKKVKSPKGRPDYWTLDDPELQQQTKEHIMRKLLKIDPTLDLSDFDLRIPERSFDKVRRIMVKNIPNFANNCWVSIKAPKHVVSMIYHLGLGQSTGSGFGVVCLNKNRGMYGLKVGRRMEKMEEAVA